MPEPILRIDLESVTPVYRQIVDSIRTLIVEGQLRPGDRLPTVRDLAVDLYVHHNTVAQAYRELEREGWLEMGRRRGATVTTRDIPFADPDAVEQFERQVRQLVAKAQADGLAAKDISAVLKTIAQARKDI